MRTSPRGSAHVASPSQPAASRDGNQEEGKRPEVPSETTTLGSVSPPPPPRHSSRTQRLEPKIMRHTAVHQDQRTMQRVTLLVLMTMLETTSAQTTCPGTCVAAQISAGECCDPSELPHHGLEPLQCCSHGAGPQRHDRLDRERRQLPSGMLLLVQQQQPLAQQPRHGGWPPPRPIGVSV